MNGHSKAETLAFSVMEAARRFGGSLGAESDAPIFVFAAGWGSGEADLQRRLPSAMAHDLALDPALLSSLAWQLVRCAPAAREGAPSNNAEAIGGGVGDTRTAMRVVDAQRCFLRGLCRGHAHEKTAASWGFTSTAATGDLALYLKLLFPRAKFIILHRSPIDAFRRCLQAMPGGAAAARRDPRFAAAFAEQWCRLIASFELWHKDVGGIVIRYDRAVAEAPGELEEYLGARLSPMRAAGEEDSDESGFAEGAPPELMADEIQVIVERTGEMAARCGYDIASTQPAPPAEALGLPPTPATTKPMARAMNCAVLVPTMRCIEPGCEDSLRQLEHRGYAVVRLQGCSAIDQGRNQLATAALEQGFDEKLWVDADTEFDPDVVERLRSHGAPIVAGICARRGVGRGFAVAPLPSTRELVMGEGGGVVEVLYAGTGFLLVRREVYSAMQRRFGPPLCDADKPRRSIPFFMPMLEDWGGRLSYLGEDYSFSRRARLCGYKILADTTIRLWHIGHRRYGIGDNGNELARQATYTHVFRPEG